MKKKLFFMTLLCAFFLPVAVLAKEPEYVEEKGHFFANGTPLIIEARTDDQEGALIKWDGGERLVPAATSVFGGSHNSDEVIETASITMNGGTVKNIFGGGLHKSIVKKATVVMNNGTVTGSVMGGGAHHLKQTDDGDFIDSSVANAKDRTKAITIVDETTVTINGGIVEYAVWGGGESYSYTGKATVTINAGKFNYVIAGGSNGYTGDASLDIYGGEIAIVQGVNRGEMDNISFVVNGGKIDKFYAGGEPDDGVNGVINESINLQIVDGEIATLEAGTSGGKDSLATDLIVAEINSKFEEKIGQDFSEENTVVTINLMLTAGNEGTTIQIPKNTTFTEEKLKELIDDVNAELVDENLKLEGFYKDEELSDPFNFDDPITDDTELFLKLVQLREDGGDSGEENHNPDTADINLALILAIVLGSATGCVVLSKKLKARA
ncbi:MAG: hypothetical protein MR031_06200 [Tenericutes bacterium]|nr:hypothetical protein [Mycoplasmatota bacterium]